VALTPQGDKALMKRRQLFGASPPLIAFFAMKVNCRQLKGENKGDSVPEIKN
jgi:hypothetical protein